MLGRCSHIPTAAIPSLLGCLYPDTTTNLFFQICWRHLWLSLFLQDSARLYNANEYARFGQCYMYDDCNNKSSIFPRFPPQSLIRYPTPQQYGAYPTTMKCAHNNGMAYYPQPQMTMQQQAYQCKLHCKLYFLVIRGILYIGLTGNAFTGIHHWDHCGRSKPQCVTVRVIAILLLGEYSNSRSYPLKATCHSCLSFYWFLLVC